MAMPKVHHLTGHDPSKTAPRVQVRAVLRSAWYRASLDPPVSG